MDDPIQEGQPPLPDRDPTRSPPPLTEDPRLRIPSILRERPGDKDHQTRPDNNDTGHTKTSFGETAKAWGMALDLVFTTVGGFILGWVFDWWRGTSPWGAIIGLGLGFVTAFVRMTRYALRAEARDQAQRDKARSQRHRKGK